MTDIIIDTEKNIICHCTGTTETQIKKLIDEGVNDLDGLSWATGVCTGCGACDYEVKAMIDALTSGAGEQNA